MMSRSTTLPSGCAARHSLATSEVSLRETEASYRGLALIARRFGIVESCLWSAHRRRPLVARRKVGDGALEKTDEVSSFLDYKSEHGCAHAGSDPDLPHRRRQRQLYGGCKEAEPRAFGGDVRHP